MRYSPSHSGLAVGMATPLTSEKAPFCHLRLSQGTDPKSKRRSRNVIAPTILAPSAPLLLLKYQEQTHIIT